MKAYSIIIFFLICQFAFADSPLTSTYFADAYKNEKIVQYAQDQKGVINRKILKYLSSSNNSIALKLACINALSWDMNGHSNAPIFLKTILKKNKCSSEEEFVSKGTANDLLCYAYLLALDNYHDVSKAKIIAQIAQSKAPLSYSVNIISALITAQSLFDSDWCILYTVCDNIRSNSSLENDFSDKAKDIIFEYMDLYSSYCE